MMMRSHSFGLLQLSLLNPRAYALLGAPIAVVVVFVYGLPAHAAITGVVMTVAAGFGITLGLHRLFAHRSFATARPVEWLLMVLGCMAGQTSPFFWIATHRIHHRHSDRSGDPHSPHIWPGSTHPLLQWFWRDYFDWANSNRHDTVADLTSRPDLAWIDRHFFQLYLVGLAIPAAVGWLVGGTAYDALVGLLWGGLFRHFFTLQVTFAVNTIGHIWGQRPYDTGDESRNSFLLGLIAFGDGWHNNHHAFPYSARHGFHWWQLDLTWSVIWLLERMGLAWDVKRPKFAPAGETDAATAVTRSRL